jgi:protein SCO1/2
MVKIGISSLVLGLSLITCKDISSNNDVLPYLGNKQIIDGKEVAPKIGTVNHWRQDSILINNDSLQKYIYVTDFFFTSCPTICPKVTKEMLRIHDAFKNEPRVKLVSYTIDPERDTPSKLKLYADNLQVNQKQWWFLNGDKDSTYALANTYFIVAMEDKDAPGGFDHSGTIVLVDKEGHVRSFSQGTDPSTTPKLITDIKKLLSSYEE